MIKFKYFYLKINYIQINPNFLICLINIIYLISCIFLYSDGDMNSQATLYHSLN